jgi:TatD DNase family protein
MLERAFQHGIDRIYMPNIDHESIEAMMELELLYSECFAMMGLHPCSVDAGFEKELYEVEDWLSKRPFCAIGEMGIDLYWDKTFFEQQKEAFVIQANLAKQKNLPLVVHTRDSMRETLELIENLQDGRLFGVIHCFTGDLVQAQKAIALGFKLGIGGVLTYKNSGLDKVVQTLGLSELVLETDAPYLAPVPHRGKRNEPSFLSFVAEKIAQLLNLSPDEVVSTTNQNALTLFHGRNSSGTQTDNILRT